MVGCTRVTPHLRGGVVYSDMSPTELQAFRQAVQETRIHKGWYSALCSSVATDGLVHDTVVPDEDILNLGTLLRVSEQFKTAFRSRAFKTAISTAWRFHSAHINALELEAVRLAVRHMRRAPSSRSHRVSIFIDNTVILGALGKGRSSSTVLNRLCRQLCASLILGDIQLELYWVPSKINPADGPSRAFQSAARRERWR